MDDKNRNLGRSRKKKEFSKSIELNNCFIYMVRGEIESFKVYVEIHCEFSRTGESRKRRKSPDVEAVELC